MTTSLRAWAGAALALLYSLAQAQAASDLSFNLGASSDYRYRGISQSRLQPAVQGGVDYVASHGLYLGAWASTIRWIEDAGALAGVDTGSAPVELDLYGGYKGKISPSLGYDAGLLQYIYPGNRLARLARNANTLELYGALGFGAVTLKYSHSLTTLFGTPDSRGSGYWELNASFAVGHGVSVAPHIGHQRIRNWSAGSYTDYSLGVAKDMAGLTFSFALVATDAKADAGFVAYPAPGGRNLGKSGLVWTVKKSL